MDFRERHAVTLLVHLGFQPLVHAPVVRSFHGPAIGQLREEKLSIRQDLTEQLFRLPTRSGANEDTEEIGMLVFRFLESPGMGLEGNPVACFCHAPTLKRPAAKANPFRAGGGLV